MGIVKKARTALAVARAGDWQGLRHRIALNVMRLGGLRFDPASAKNFARWQRRHPIPSRAETERRWQGVETPTVSVLVPVYNAPAEWLNAAIGSVVAQHYTHWQLVLADDASPSPHVAPLLAEWAARDARIKVVRREKNGGIAAATQSAFDAATGSFIALLDNDDVLFAHALDAMMWAQRENQADWLYSDFVMLEPNGTLTRPFFKPAFSPERLLSQMYVNHLQVMRRSVVAQVGGFRAGFDGSQDFDLALRLMDATKAISHVPLPLYQWRAVPGSTADDYNAKPYANEAGKRALQSAWERRGVVGISVHDGHAPGTFRVDRPLPREPLVSLLIPFRDRVDLTRACVESVLRRSTYTNLELVLIDNGSVQPETAEWLHAVQRDQRVRVLRDESPFNYSQLNNRGAATARGEVLVLLNNDTEVESPDWLQRMLLHALNPEVGCVGPLLLYRSGRIQHAGIVLGVNGTAGHVFRGYDRSYDGVFGSIHSEGNFSAVTGACLMVRRDVYLEAGGLDETLPVSWNDIDFCLRLCERKLRHVYTGHAVLRHYESETRGDDRDAGGRERFIARWSAQLARDPYFNPNFSRQYEDCRF